MNSQDAKPKDTMKLVWFRTPKETGKVDELLRAADSFQGPFDVFLCPANPADVEREKAFLLEFEDCLSEIHCASNAIGTIASNLLNDHIIQNKELWNEARVNSYSTLLEAIQKQIQAILTKYKGLELAQIVCCRPQQSENQGVVL